MSPMDWAFLPLQRYFSFSGRSPRPEYWWFYLFQVSLTLITTVIDLLLDLGQPGAPISTTLLLNITLFIPSIAVAIRRLHDINQSGWTLMNYAAMYIAVFVIGLVVSFVFGFLGTLTMVFGVIGVTAGFIFLMASEGNPGENVYGASPYGLNYGQR